MRVRHVMVLATVLASGCAAGESPRRAPAAVAAPTDETPAIVERALPAVVLLLAPRADGKTTYGAGLIVDDRGHVLTSLHVVAEATSLSAMLYRKGRTSYTPMDGGLGRFVFENQRDVLPARIVASDPGADLALVKVEADTSAYPRLPIARAQPKVGDRVLALGHPQETVWSFTSGVVGALHQGAIQHDALVSHGSSGGPLLDAHGEVVGIVTAKVTSEAQGLSFARPIAMATALLAAERSGGPPPGVAGDLDLSTPERAVRTCWRAQEMASPALAECLDWDAQWRLFEEGVVELGRRKLAPEGALELDAFVRRQGARDEWVARSKERLAESQKGAGSATKPPAPTLTPEQKRAIDEVAKLGEERGRALAERNGLKVDLRDAKSLHELLKMGIRVEEARTVTPGVAWVLITGRNPDGTPYRFSECWAKATGPGRTRWLQRTPPSPEEVAKLPAGWPPPIDDFHYGTQRMMARLVERIATPGGSSSAVDACCHEGG